MTVQTPLGRLVRDESGGHLEFIRLLPQTPEAVWRALTEPAELAAWFGTWTGDPAEGHVQLSMSAEDDDSPQTVRITRCDAPAHLSVETPSPTGTWPLEIALAESDEGTRLSFTHHLAQTDDSTDIGPGWHFYLDRLHAALTGEPVPQDWEQYYPALAASYERPK